MPGPDTFSPDYETARSRLLFEFAERGWAHEAHAIAAKNVPNQRFTIDVGRIGPGDAERVLVLSSGLHGAEGYFGSAVQLSWVRSLPHLWSPPAGCAVLILHALNPYGFARTRRANEDNVDLNRNFLKNDEFELLRERTLRDFGPLEPFMDPPYPPGRIDWFRLIFPWMLVRFGLPLLQKVMPVGQYAFPKGIFYGGTQVSSTTRIVMTEMPRWLESARAILHLDFHTGLGKFGDYQLLASCQPDAKMLATARQFFGNERVCFDYETNDGYRPFGDMGEWLSRWFSDRDYLYFCAEFGTYGTRRVIGALRRENQAHHWGLPGSKIYESCKREALEAFTPASPIWRQSVISKSVELIHSSLRFCADQGTVKD